MKKISMLISLFALGAVPMLAQTAAGGGAGAMPGTSGSPSGQGATTAPAGTGTTPSAGVQTSPGTATPTTPGAAPNGPGSVTTGPSRPISPNNPTINGANGNPTAIAPGSSRTIPGTSGASTQNVGTNAAGIR